MRTSLARLVTAAVAALLLAACTDDGDQAVGGADTSGSSTTSSSTTSTTAAPTTTTTAPTTTSEPTVDVGALRPPAPASDPAALAAMIAEAEAAIRDPGTSPADLARAALAQQVAYRQLGTLPEWDAAVLDALPAGLRSVAMRHAAARRELRGMHRTIPTTLPAWRIVAPEPAEVLLSLYREAEAKFGIPWPYLAAINLVETGTGRIRGTSTAGAQGPMQFMPATWAAYGAGGDVNDTRDAIMGAARYLAANNGAVDIDNALFRYNNSQRYVRAVKLYADLIAEHPRAFYGFHGWGVWYLTEQREVYLPVGYEQTEPVPVEAYRPG